MAHKFPNTLCIGLFNCSHFGGCAVMFRCDPSYIFYDSICSGEAQICFLQVDGIPVISSEASSKTLSVGQHLGTWYHCCLHTGVDGCCGFPRLSCLRLVGKVVLRSRLAENHVDVWASESMVMGAPGPHDSLAARWPSTGSPPLLQPFLACPCPDALSHPRFLGVSTSQSGCFLGICLGFGFPHGERGSWGDRRRWCTQVLAACLAHTGAWLPG